MAAGYDDKGLMYALLDVANRISWSIDHSTTLQFIREVTSKPEMRRYRTAF
ncbi:MULTISPECIES: hypothetical protein [Bacteroidales]|uniref:hypothetical protein n=1 Tax=Bacteroidales TaxID=171549 RepID=UPI0015F32B1B|nr:hypothetical protein [Bacteroides ovatus]